MASSTTITGVDGNAATTTTTMTASASSAEAVALSADYGDLGPPRSREEKKMGGGEVGGEEVTYSPTSRSNVNSPSSSSSAAAAAAAAAKSSTSVGKKFATAQTPRHCNIKNRGGGDTAVVVDDNDDAADDNDDDDGDDRITPPRRHSNPDQVSPPPHSAAARGEDPATTSQGKFIRHHEHWDDPRHQHAAYDGTSHELRGTTRGGGNANIMDPQASSSKHYGRPPPPYPYHQHPPGTSGAQPVGAPYYDSEHHYQHHTQYYDERYYEDPPYDDGRYDYTDHHHPHYPFPPGHHRPSPVAHRGSGAPTVVRRYRPPPPPYHPHHRPRHPHHPPPGHPRPSPAGTMVDPQYQNDHHLYDLEHGESQYNAHRHHRAVHHNPYPPRGGGGGGGAYDYSSHRYDASAPPSPLSSTQRCEDRHYTADEGYPPASREEAGTKHHHAGVVVVAAGERPLSKRSPKHHHQVTGGTGERVGSSLVGEGRQRQHPDRVLPDSATMSNEVDGSTTSVRHSASSSVGASIHAVSSSYSNEESRHTMAAKQSPGVVTNSGSSGASIETMMLPNQPSLKSNEDDVHSSTSDSSWRQLEQIASVDKEEMLRMQSSSKSVSSFAVEYEASTPFTAADVAGAAGKDEKEVMVTTPKSKLLADAAVVDDNGNVCQTDLTATTSVVLDDKRCEAAVEKRDSPGEVREAPSSLSRTSSLSNSPTDEQHQDVASRRSLMVNDDDVIVAVKENHEYAPPPSQGLGSYHPQGVAVQHQSHPLPPHSQSQHHRSPYHPNHYCAQPPHPPSHLHPSRLTGAGGTERGRYAASEGLDENSPSASTISTKASIAAPNRFFKDFPPTTNMVSRRHVPSDRRWAATLGEVREGGSYEPSPHRMMHARHLLSLSSDNNNEQPHQSIPTHALKHPVHVENSRERLSHKSVGSNFDYSVDGCFSCGEELERGEETSPIPPRNDSSPTVTLDGCVMAGPLAADERFMAESPAAASTGAGSSHYSQQSLELGAMQSWETAGKPLAGWSVCSGNTFSGMVDGLKDGVFSSAFSFSESSDPVKDNNGNGEIGFNKNRDRVVGIDNEEDDSSPKSILSKSGEKRKIAPGTHVQFSSDRIEEDLEIATSMASASSVDGAGNKSRKRSRELIVPRSSMSAMPHPQPPPSPQHLHDEYYHGDNPPRHAIYPYDQYRHPPPPHPSHRPPHDHRNYIEEDPYYDYYYGPPPPPPWSKDDDDALMDLMRKVKSPKNWVPIAKKFEGKSEWEIQDRWTRYLKPGSRKGQWTDEEDAVVVETVQNSMEEPFTRWSDLAQRLPGRVGKQVRDRW
ncbi:hypothetical protein ACHAXA_011331 [Cyclostephanos tholiformis]|uniref:Uncharacterized protein n=1 Tax=Cyclostephanos tholiformis TaxID=382380 RepID=A0ABD3REA2_9STRA